MEEYEITEKEMHDVVWNRTPIHFSEYGEIRAWGHCSTDMSDCYRTQMRISARVSVEKNNLFNWKTLLEKDGHWMGEKWMYEELVEMKDTYLKSFSEDRRQMEEIGFKCVGYGDYQYGDIIVIKWFDASNILPMNCVTVSCPEIPRYSEYDKNIREIFMDFLKEYLSKYPDKVYFLPSQCRDWMICRKKN